MQPELLNQRQFDRFREFIYKVSGNRVDGSKIALVSNRIRRRLKAGDFVDFDAYYLFLNSPKGASELEQFLDAVTTNETHFFRTPKHFEWFKTDFITEAASLARKGDRPKSLRVWSAACSTGEELYSLAICLAENTLRLKDWKLTLLGTDISERVVREARTASYASRSLEEVGPTQRKRYFEESDDGATWTVRPALRDMVEFRWHNLMKPLRLPAFDCIFIRNVLIYFDRAAKQVVIDNLIAALARGGYLVVGPSEGIYDMLDPLVKKSTFLYQKP